MKRIFKILTSILIFSMFFTIYMPISNSTESQNSITILFTHDMHDHFYPVDIQEEGRISTVGGYARLYSAIKAEREKDPELLLVDAGDFSMGTLFQTIFAAEAPQLKIMGKMGYDATTFGNHEFDFRSEGLANSLKAAKNSEDYLPQIVSANISFPADDKGNLTPSLEYLKTAMDEYGVQDYFTITRNDIKIGIFGLTGKDAASNAPMSEVKFLDVVESAKKTVDILKNEEKAELIVCLSHSGTSDKKSQSEDEILAEKVPGIDVIISGHTHTKLEKPIVIGNTIIGSSGKYGENLGILNISKGPGENWKIDNYELRPIDDSLALESDIADTIEAYKQVVQEEYLSNFKMEFDEVLAYTSFSFTPSAQLGKAHAEDTLGNLIGDAYIYAIKEAEGNNYEPITIAVVPYGTIRGSFVKGDITVSDTFNVSSLGIGSDKIPGYPLLTVYLTGKELKTIAEVDASIAPIMSAAQLYVAGLSYTFNPHRLIFNKVTDVRLQDIEGIRAGINDNELYRVAAGLYTAQMLSVVGDKSFGLLSIIPKTKDGTPITDFEKQIVYQDNHEVKEWAAIAEYLKSFDKSNGVPQIPLYYSEARGRKIVDNDTSIISIIKNPNKLALSLYLAILVIIAIIAIAIVFVKRRKKAKLNEKIPSYLNVK